MPVVTAPTPILKDSTDQTEVRKAFTDMARSVSTNSSVVQPLNSVIGSSQSFNLSNSQGIQTIYIPSQFLVASSVSQIILTLQASSSGTTIQIPIAPSGSTISSGNLFFYAYVDSSGNVSSSDWLISGSNANGNFEQHSNGFMSCWFSAPAVTTSAAIGAVFIASSNLTFPISFVGINPTIVSGAIQIAGYVWPGQTLSLTLSSMTQYITGATNTSQGGMNYIASGRWRL